MFAFIKLRSFLLITPNSVYCQDLFVIDFICTSSCISIIHRSSKIILFLFFFYFFPSSFSHPFPNHPHSQSPRPCFYQFLTLLFLHIFFHTCPFYPMLFIIFLFEFPQPSLQMRTDILAQVDVSKIKTISLPLEQVDGGVNILLESKASHRGTCIFIPVFSRTETHTHVA